MTILFVTDRPPYPPNDGVAIKTFNLIRSLSRRHSVLLLSYCPDGEPTCQQVTVLRTFCEAVRFVTLPKRSRHGVLAAVQRVLLPYTAYAAPYQPEFEAAFRAMCEERRVDVIHFDLIFTTSHLNHAPKQCTSIASINDSLTLAFADQAFRDRSVKVSTRVLRLLQLPAVSLMERYAYRRFDAVHVVARRDGSVLRMLGSNKRVVVIPNGVDTEYFAPGLPAARVDSARIGCLGDFSGSAYYAEWFVRNVFRAVRKEVPNARLSLIGKAPPPSVRNRLRERGVEWTGTLEDVRPCVQACSVMVSPTMKTSGFLNKIAIGMASGKAMIGWEYNWNAFEHARNHEHYLGVRTTEEFRRTLIEVLKGKIDTDRIGASARAFVQEEYSWDTVARRMESSYRQLRSAGQVEVEVEV